MLLSGILALPAFNVRSAPPATIIPVRYSTKHQVVEGFGTCIDTWHKDVAVHYQSSQFLEFYRTTLGASALRIELWGGLAPVVRERWEHISWHDFRTDDSGGRGRVTIDTAKRLDALSGGNLRIIATAWSPPAWMKINGSMGNGHPRRKNFALDFNNPVELGEWTQALAGSEGEERYRYLASNKLRRDRYLHFAKYLVEWTRFYRSIGIELYALSPANELRFSHWFESCVYTPDEYAEIVETVAWMFQNQGEPPMPIFGPEHMTWDVEGNRRYLEALQRRPAAWNALVAIASHGYVDGYAGDLRKESTAAFGRLAAGYGKKIWITEGGFGNHEWPAPLHQLGTSFVYALRDGGVSLLTAWQTLTRYPPTEHGLMSVRGPTKKTYVAMQFWRFIRPGMVRVEVPVSGNPDVVAFEDSAAAKAVIVLLNRSRSPSTIALKPVDKRHVAVESAFITDATRNCAEVADWNDPHTLMLPPESVATLVLRTQQ